MQKLTFRIIDEESILFKDKKLFVVRTNNDDKRFGVDIITNNKCLGSTNTPNIDISKEVFSLVAKRLKEFKTTPAAVKFVKNLFALKGIVIIRSTLKRETVSISQTNIKTISKKTGCRLVSIYNYAGSEKKPGYVTIQALNKENEIVAEFVGKQFSDKFKFTAENNINVGFMNELVNFG